MPLIDMPLEELRQYQGRNPRPPDFDAYWKQALAELDATLPSPQIDPASFAASFAECGHLWFSGVRGARIHAKSLRPKGPLKGAVLMFHGYSMSAGDWADKLAYVAAGYWVFALDVRGQGGWSEDVGGVKGMTLRGHIVRGVDGPPEDLLYRHIFLDCAQLCRVALDFTEGGPLYAMGASQGGGLTLACAALEPRVERIVPWYPFLCDYRRVWEMDLAKDAYDEMQAWFRRFDPTHDGEEEFFTKLGYIDVQHLAPRIKAETLMAVGLMDTICPPSSQFAAYNRIAAKKDLVIYPDFGHEGLPGMNDRAFSFLTR
ncbi:MAG TPA: acetylxylan esterase [Fimbriimonadaceae bacterium]|nr:acetylxylan esterase [Fimbriimonadaceae bacterium]